MTVPLGVRTITARVALSIAAIAVVVGIALDQTLFPGHARIVGYSVFVSAIAVYSVSGLLDDLLITSFTAAYVSLHVAACFLTPPDSSYVGAALILLAFADYAAFGFMVYFLRRNSERGRSR
jgi:cyanate permease